MKREEFVDFLNTLEKKYPVNAWKIEEIHLWPLIKNRLAFAFHSNIESLPKKKSSEPILRKVIKTISGLKDFFLICLKPKSAKKTDLFCLAPHFRFKFHKVYRNRYFNQLVKNCEQREVDFLFLEYANTTHEYRKNIDFPDKVFFLENVKYLALFLREITWKKYNNDWVEFDSFLSEVNDTFGGTFLSKETILKQFVYIDILKTFYKKLFNAYAINEVYVLCYYVSEMYAVNLAASELGIDSWDIQHGGQGNLHTSYSNFNAIPSTGYKLLPKKFWTWDSASANEIKKWVTKQQYHQVEVKGNPWIDYCRHNFSLKIQTDKKIILYTMQPFANNLIDGFILETIRKTPTDYVWWLRLHPRQIKEIENLKFLIDKEGLKSRVNIEDATALPLPEILGKVHVHLSKFSGSILEAYMMEVKTIILNNIGVQNFAEVINSGYGLIHLEEDSNILLQKILSLK